MSSKSATRAAMEEEKKTRTASPAKDTKKKAKVTDETKVPEAVQEKSDSNKEQNDKTKATAKSDKKQKAEEVKEKQPKEAAKPSEKTATPTKSDKKETTAVEVKDAIKEKEIATENKEKTKTPETKGKGKKDQEKEKTVVSEEVKKVDIPEKKEEEKASTSANKEVKSNVPDAKSNVSEPKSDVSEVKTNVPEPKSNGSSSKVNGSGSKVNGSGSKVNGSSSKVNGSEQANDHNGDTMETIDLDNDDDCVMSGPDQDNDEHFPELSYDDTSDNDGFELSTPDFLGVNRSTTRRSQAKSTATPETPKSLSRVATAELRSDSASTLSSAEEEPPKIQKTKEDSSSMRLRSSDVSTYNERSEDLQSQNELNAANLLKTDTNFSKSRIKISPYRRGARPLDSASMIVNYTGSTTTLDDSFNTSSQSDKTSDYPDSDASQVNSLRSIKGRRSYKELREVTLRSVTLQRIRDKANEANKAKEAHKAKMEALIAGAQAETSSVPIAQVVGRKRRTSNTQDVQSHQDTDVSEVAAKRARLLQRVVVSPFSSLMSRGRSVLASSTPLTMRRAIPQVVVESYTDLPTEMAFDDIKTNEGTDLIVDSEEGSHNVDVEVGQSALDGQGDGERKRCSIM